MSARSVASEIPIEVQRAGWEALWDELLCPEEDDLPVEEARQDERDEVQAPLHRKAAEAA